MSLVEKYVYNLSDVIALVDFFPSSVVLLKNFGMSSKNLLPQNSKCWFNIDET